MIHTPSPFNENKPFTLQYTRSISSHLNNRINATIKFLFFFILHAVVCIQGHIRHFTGHLQVILIILLWPSVGKYFFKLRQDSISVWRNLQISAKLVVEKYTKIQTLQINCYISVKYNDINKNLESFQYVPTTYAVYAKTFRWSIIVRL